MDRMFLVFGFRTIQRDVRNSAPERRYCARCGLISDFRHQTQRLWAALFLVPVIPLRKGEPVITCNRCGATYYANHPEPETSDGKTVLVCPVCSGKMRIPLKLDNSIRVTCPHCRDQFTVSVNRS